VRRAATALAILLAVASTASAQMGPGSGPSNQGSFAIDAMVAPTTGFGFGYYLTDGLSLRPWLGLGYSGSGFFANVGAQLQYEFGTNWKVSPYVSASGQYSHSPAAGYLQTTRSGSPTGQLIGYQADGGQAGAGAGLRYRVARSFSLFAEGRVLYTTYATGTYGQQGWGSFNMGDHTRGEFVLGLSYLFQ
jgi:hypothetical protein